MANLIDIPNAGEKIKAAWGANVTNAVNSISQLHGDGKNIFVSSGPNGYTIRFAGNVDVDKGEPMAFDVALFSNSIGNLLDIYIYLPSPLSELVYRNAYPVLPSSYVHSDPDNAWSLLQRSMMDTKTYYIYVQIEPVPNDTTNKWPSGRAGRAQYNIAVSENEPGWNYTTAKDTPTIVAKITNGEIVQLHRGNVNTFYTLPDAETETEYPEINQLNIPMIGCCNYMILTNRQRL